MGTEHLKARCVCKLAGNHQGRTHVPLDINPGCPMHGTPVPIPVNERPDMVNNPVHYSAQDGIPFECIVVARDLSFDIGNAVKYLWRADRKNGREDIEKARWYLKDAIKWGNPFYIGNTPMQFNARCATLIRAQTDPLRRRFFRALRDQSARHMLDAVDDMLTSLG